MDHATWHWLCLDDDDLALIEDGPESDDESVQPTYDQLWDWVVDVREAILESLETA